MKTILSLTICLLLGNMLTAQINDDAPPIPPPPPPTGFHQEVFVVVEQMPRFPGCEYMEGSNTDQQKCTNKKLIQFVAENMQYPAEAKKAGIEGRCIVNFIVEKDGSIGFVKLMRDIGGGCGAEAVRVVELMNEKGIKWIPGKQRGKAVRVKFTLPVQFKFDDKKKER
jgi:protein TonB